MAGTFYKAWRCVRYFLLQYWMLILWILFISLIFWSSYSKYKREPKYFYLRQILGSGLCLSRGMASVLNISCFMVILPTCRFLMTCTRAMGTQVSVRFVCKIIDATKGFHMTCAYTIVLAAPIHVLRAADRLLGLSELIFILLVSYFLRLHVLHSIAHIVNALNFSLHYNMQFKDINMARFKGEDPLKMVIRSVPGITGILMVVLLGILCASSVKYARTACYDMFWFCHHLFIPFLLLLICHPMSGLLKEQNNTVFHIPGCYYSNLSYAVDVGHPEHFHGDSGVCVVDPTFIPQDSETWKWITAALSIYTVDLGYRFLRRRTSAYVLSVHADKNHLMMLKFKKDGFKAEPGQFVFLQCSFISSLEWHPFTISKCPTEDDSSFTIYMRTNGDWSSCLKKHLLSLMWPQAHDSNFGQISLSFPATLYLCTKISVDGPFSSCLEDVLNHSVSICIAGGIGITPFASHLYSLRADPEKVLKLRRLHLIWICREVEMVCCFADIIFDVFYLLWKANKPDIFEVQLHFSKFISWREIETALKERHHFMKPRINFGRPEWPLLFDQWSMMYKKKHIGIFCCGPPSLTAELKECCKWANLQDCNFSYYHESFS